MSLKERENAILEYLDEHREASVNELCSALFVSEATMRRDLAYLNEAGKLIRTHGGALMRRDPWENIPQSYREREHLGAKTVIGKKCLSLISDGDTVMVDSSSTALSLLPLLGNKKSIVLITNNAKAPMLLCDTKVKVFVSGGELAPGTYAYVGSYAEKFIASFNADIAFFSARTLTVDGRITDNAIAENNIRNIMLKNSRRSVLMLDSKKIGEPCMNTLCELRDIDYIVSECDISNLFKNTEVEFL